MLDDVDRVDEGDEGAVRRLESRLRLLDATTRRVGTTLDVRRTAQEVVDVVVPAFADSAAVDVLEDLWEGAPVGEPAGRLRRLTGEAPVPPAPRLPVGPVRPSSGTGDSVVVVPLLARGEALGLLVLAREQGRPTWTDADLTLAEEVAARTALALDNARLYSRERAAGIALQRALLPQEPPALDLVEVASRYRPSGGAASVGGDWYDSVQLAGGRVALVVGDVMGRGLRAAAAMGQLRTALRTLAVLDLMPEDVISSLDDVAHSLDGVQLATCVYAVFDPVAGQLCFASAGHLPPMLREPDGTTHVLGAPSGAPLGVGGVPFESRSVEVAHGSTLLLYTDGLVESRTTGLDSGLQALCEALARGPSEPEPLCDAVLAALAERTDPEDDVALLAARLGGVRGGDVRSWAVPTDVAAVAQARRLVAGQLVQWRLDDLVDTVALLVSELVTNAIRYATDPIELTLLRLGDRLEVSVEDRDARLPRLRRAGSDDEGGRGLHLVGTIARSWGARATPYGKVVWFDVALPAADAA